MHKIHLLKKSAWAYKHLVLGAVGIFVYVGAEVSIGSFLVNYFGQDYIVGYTAAKAGEMVALYWAGAMIGRFIGSAVQKKVAPSKVLVFSSIAAIILVAASMMTFGHVAMITILAVGLFNSVMFSHNFLPGYRRSWNSYQPGLRNIVCSNSRWRNNPSCTGIFC